jgi:3-oxoacyl-[acyl-carrier-protein] synthase-1
MKRAAPVGEKAVITGMGVVSAMGLGKDAVLHSMLHGLTGVGRTRFLDSRLAETHLFGEVGHSSAQLAEMAGITDHAALPRTTLLAMVAATEALADAGLKGADMPLVSATSVGGMDRSEEYLRQRLADDHQRVADLLTHDCGMNTDLLARHLGLHLGRTTVSTACSGGANAIMIGARMIRHGLADRVLVGGADGLCRFTANGFNALMILDREWSRPFSADRAGLNLGEGAAFLVLESERSGMARGAHIWGAVAGYANTNDAYHQTASSPEGEGAYLAMATALKVAGTDPSEVDHINAHGTATPNNDASESAAINRLFGVNVPPVVSTKSYTGHTLAASGAIEAVISLLCIQHGVVPAALNLRVPMPDNTWSPSPIIIQKELNTVVSNSFGFGGNNTSLVFKKAVS